MDEGRALTDERSERVARRRVLPIAALFAVAGVLHFVTPGFFIAIVPPWVPDAGLAVMASGVAELLGALGLLLHRTRRVAAWGLVALLVAVFPANVRMLQQAQGSDASTMALLLLWLRLPLQAVLIWWVWRAGAHRAKAQRAGAPSASP